MSAINSLANGARPLGAAIGALVGGLYGAEACFVVAAFGFFLQAAVILLSPVIGLQRQPRHDRQIACDLGARYLSCGFSSMTRRLPCHSSISSRFSICLALSIAAWSGFQTRLAARKFAGREFDTSDNGSCIPPIVCGITCPTLAGTTVGECFPKLLSAIAHPYQY